MIQFPYRVHEQHTAQSCATLLSGVVARISRRMLAPGSRSMGLNSRYHVMSPARSCLTAWIAGAACDQHRACRRLVVGVQVTLAHTIAAVLSCAMGGTSETVLLSGHILSEGYSVAWRSVFRSASCVGDASLDQFIGVCLT